MISGFFRLFIWFVFGVLSIFFSFMCHSSIPLYIFLSFLINDWLRSVSFSWIQSAYLNEWEWPSRMDSKKGTENTNDEYQGDKEFVCRLYFRFSVQSTICNGALPYRNEYHQVNINNNYNNNNINNIETAKWRTIAGFKFIKSNKINEIRSEIIIIDCWCICVLLRLSTVFSVRDSLRSKFGKERATCR